MTGSRLRSAAAVPRPPTTNKMRVKTRTLRPVFFFPFAMSELRPGCAGNVSAGKACFWVVPAGSMAGEHRFQGDESRADAEVNAEDPGGTAGERGPRQSRQSNRQHR